MVISYKGKSIVLLSDTHGKHRNLPRFDADIIIHTGDACTDGNIDELDDFFDWFQSCNATYKIFVAGNHELLFEFSPDEFRQMIPKGITFMDNSVKSIAGLTFVSIVARPWLLSYSEVSVFSKKIDFLLTHGPPENIFDKGSGCKMLLQFVKEHAPAYHVFGHIHEMGQKKETIGETTFINASIFTQV